jgi:hypothetical protein
VITLSLMSRPDSIPLLSHDDVFIFHVGSLSQSTLKIEAHFL